MAEDEGDASAIDEHYVRHFLASPVSGALLAHDDGDAVGLLSYATCPASSTPPTRASSSCWS